MKVTNIRINMWDSQLCDLCKNTRVTDTTRLLASVPTPRSDTIEDSSEKFSGLLSRFALYDLIIRGTCFCNGHADSCVPLNDDDSEPDDLEQDVVSECDQFLMKR